MIFATEHDPNCEPESTCHLCDDILVTDMFGEWFCPTCVRKEQESNE